MGKARTLPALALLLVSVLIPHRMQPAVAQSATPTCSGTALVSPMAGHYTGPWQSTATYTFQTTFSTGPVTVTIPMTIKGTLDVTIDPNGQVSGTATGDVNAPVVHDGQQDISSGTGTIRGRLTGLVTTGTAQIILNAPIIDMFWGLFGGGTNGRWENHITMPNYTLAVAGFDCVSTLGTLRENGFPPMNLVPDGLPDAPAVVPGVGQAGGSWQLINDDSSTFSTLSMQVDSFITAANALIHGPPAGLTATAVQSAILAPWHTLLTSINAHPSVARCLLDKLGTWEAQALPLLFAHATALAQSSNFADLRTASDLLAETSTLNGCTLPDGGATAALSATERADLDTAVRSGTWADMAVLARELLLNGTAPATILSALTIDLHAKIAGGTGTAAVLDAGRVAYALGDDADASAATHRATTALLRPHASVPWKPSKKKSGKKRRPKSSHRAKPTATPRPKPTATPRPKPTATPVPKSTLDLLLAGIVHMSASTDGSPPTLSWNAVPSATRYLVLAWNASGLTWAWAGTATSVTYGDTSLNGVPAMSAAQFAAFTSWSVLALNESGAVVGAAFRHT